MYQEIKEELLRHREEEFAAFAASLLPGESRLIGVRLPILRRMAKRIAKGEWKEYLSGAPEDSFEEIMLKGMVIGCAEATLEERLAAIAAFVPKIDNWSVCDSFCTGLKFIRDHREETRCFLDPYLHAEQEFHVRFAVVVLLDFYITPQDISWVLSALNEVSHEGYYVKMAVAWALSACYTQFPETVLQFLTSSDCVLDDFTYNKALQKMTESLKVDQETKAVIRAMKRKGEKL